MNDLVLKRIHNSHVCVRNSVYVEVGAGVSVHVCVYVYARMCARVRACVHVRMRVICSLCKITRNHRHPFRRKLGKRVHNT